MLTENLLVKLYFAVKEIQETEDLSQIYNICKNVLDEDAELVVAEVEHFYRQDTLTQVLTICNSLREQAVDLEAPLTALAYEVVASKVQDLKL